MPSHPRDLEAGGRAGQAPPPLSPPLSPPSKTKNKLIMGQMVVAKCVVLITWYICKIIYKEIA